VNKCKTLNNPASTRIEQAQTGAMIIVSAPSGAGKTSLIHGLLERDSRCRLSVSYTTRAARPGERDGIDYHFVSNAQFQQRLLDNDFMEHAEVYGNRYGTSRSATQALLTAGLDVLLEIDWQGGQKIRQLAPDTVGIFVLPPSLDTLESRLRQRAQDSESVIAGRMAAARTELSHWPEYDFLLLNDDYAQTLQQLLAIITALRCRRERLQAKISQLFPDS
jgi:guanylate kinase